MHNLKRTPADDTVLASQEELIGLLAHMAAPATRHSSHERQDALLAREAFLQLFPSSVSHEPRPPAASEPANRETAPPPSLRIQVTAVEVSRQAFAAVTENAVSRVRRRHFCTCNKCKWCLDNARWVRIFNEKFADPSYYGGVCVRHNSSLAGAR